MLDGEIVCLAADGRSVLNRLLFRRDRPPSFAFDLLSIDGEDQRPRPMCHSDGMTMSWLKVRNPAYSQMEGRPILSIRRARAAHAGPFTSGAA